MEKQVSPLESLYKLGFALHHLHPKSKRPIEMRWATGARKSLEELRRTHTEGMNIGVRLGAASKVGNAYLAVIDCDVKSAEKKHVAEMREKLNELVGGAWLEAPAVLSGRGNGSQHIYFRTAEPARATRLGQSAEKVRVYMPSAEKPSSYELENLSKEDIAKGVRLRPAWEISLMGEGQQVVLPPSRHPDTGKRYSWARKVTSLDDLPILDNRWKKAAAVEKDSNFTFEILDVDLISRTELPEEIYKKIVDGEGVSDKSSALLGVATAMIKANFTRDEILSVLTDKGNFLGAAAYEHTSSSNRMRAGAWLWNYTVKKAWADTSAEEIFRAEVVETVMLDDDAAEKQRKEIAAVPRKESGDWRDRMRTTKDGVYRNTFYNIVTLLRGVCGDDIFRHDKFTVCDRYGRKPPWGGSAGDEMRDVDANRIKYWLDDAHMIEASLSTIHEAIVSVADANAFHPVREYLDRLPAWDGVPRIDSWLRDYMAAEAEEPYLSAISRKVLCAMIARIYEPGCKFDHVLILVGEQGIRKSTSALALAAPWSANTAINVADKDSVMNMKGQWIIELGELSSMAKNDVNQLKEFVSRTTDRIRVPFGRLAENFPRQCIFIGTTNSEEFLKDTTGNRRYWPVKVGRCDVTRIERDRDQLLAEAKFAYELGEPLWLETKEMEAAARSEQESRVIEDFTLETLAHWLGSEDPEDAMGQRISRERFTLRELYESGGPFPGVDVDRAGHGHRVGASLRKLGFEKRQVWDAKTKTAVKTWVKTKV